jgi:predicted secreted protein
LPKPSITTSSRRKSTGRWRSTGCGRGRWKIENEHNNVLKNRGYNLEHNFGHGKNHACEIYAVLNLLGFLMHGLMLLVEEEYQKTRASFGKRETFFEALRFSFRRFPHESREAFLIFVPGDEPGG